VELIDAERSNLFPFSGCLIAPAKFTQLKWCDVPITISLATVATPECTLIKYRHKSTGSFYDASAECDEMMNFLVSRLTCLVIY